MCVFSLPKQIYYYVVLQVQSLLQKNVSPQKPGQPECMYCHVYCHLIYFNLIYAESCHKLVSITG